MLEYPIKFWEPVISGCDQTPLPSLYIEPDVELLKYFNQNGNTVECTVFDTGMGAFDGKTFIATVDRSANMPNDRPNYYLATGLYIITLNNYSEGGACGWWNGYPPTPGKVSFQVGPYKSYSAPVVDNFVKTLPRQPQRQTKEPYEAPKTINVQGNKDFVTGKGVWLFLLMVLLVGFFVMSSMNE